MKQGVYDFKVTIRQQLNYLWQVPITLALAFAAGIFAARALINTSGFWYIFFFVVYVDTFPTLALHIQYWLKNRNCLLEIDASSRQLTWHTGTDVFIYAFVDITNLIYYRNLGKGTWINSFGQYRYYKIIFSDKKEIYITCIMMDNIGQTLETLLHRDSEKHTKFLCLM